MLVHQPLPFAQAHSPIPTLFPRKTEWVGNVLLPVPEPGKWLWGGSSIGSMSLHWQCGTGGVFGPQLQEVFLYKQ